MRKIVEFVEKNDGMFVGGLVGRIPCRFDRSVGLSTGSMCRSADCRSLPWLEYVLRVTGGSREKVRWRRACSDLGWLAGARSEIGTHLAGWLRGAAHLLPL